MTARPEPPAPRENEEGPREPAGEPDPDDRAERWAPVVPPGWLPIPDRHGDAILP